MHGKINLKAQEDSRRTQPPRKSAAWKLAVYTESKMGEGGRAWRGCNIKNHKAFPSLPRKNTLSVIKTSSLHFHPSLSFYITSLCLTSDAQPDLARLTAVYPWGRHGRRGNCHRENTFAPVGRWEWRADPRDKGEGSGEEPETGNGADELGAMGVALTAASVRAGEWLGAGMSGKTSSGDRGRSPRGGSQEGSASGWPCSPWRQRVHQLWRTAYVRRWCLGRSKARARSSEKPVCCQKYCLHGISLHGGQFPSQPPPVYSEAFE